MGIELEINETPPTSSAKGQIREKWGAAVEGGGLTGYLALPEVLIRSQKRLQLTSTEMMVLINILTHWWRVDAKPFPGNYTIAKRMGVSRRTVQRAVKSMVNKGLISTAPMIHTEDDQTADIDWLDDENEEEDEDEMAEKALETPYSTVRLIDLSGLVARLNECALELREYNARTEAIKEDY